MTTSTQPATNAGTVRIAGGQGFYGDAAGPLADVLTEQPDYVVLASLSELTLAVLQKDRSREEALGYTRDLPVYLHELLPAILEGRTTVVTNAGGVNPVEAARHITQAAERFGMTGFTVATVLGDDLLARPDLLPESFPTAADLLFANAYLGARPIVKALDAGADLVITGKVTDTALFLAPLMHRHGWAADDWDRLAAGSVVGHLLESSGQATGGNHGGRWWEVPEPWRFGFPLADVAADGSAEIFKPAVAGGRVDFDTVRQQLLYEVHDPSAYRTPDVVVDLTTLSVDDLGSDRVRVSGVRGEPATGRYTVLAATADGYAADTTLAYGWPDAEAKARAAADLARKRVELAGLAVEDWHVELFGVNALHGPAVGAPAHEPAEVVVRLAWRCADRDTAGQVARHVTPLGLSGPPPGLSPAGRARPRASQLLRLHHGLVDGAAVDDGVRVSTEEV